MDVRDRRESARVPVRLSATYRSVTATTEGLVTDLSRLGLFFSGAPGDGIGTEAVIDVLLPNARLSLAGQVARRDDGTAGIGFRFGDLADDDRRLIANIVLSAHSAG